MKHKSSRPGSNSADGGKAAAEGLAIAALEFLAADETRLWAFLNATGLDLADLGAAAGEPGFLLAILEHLAEDESLLMSFCANAGIDPAAIMQARARLAGPAPDGLREG